MLIKKQRGQVSLLFALLMPIFLLFAGLALDLGWYYLNVSRLQNAADAAAVAGAQTLVANVDTFNDYKNISLTNKFPGGTSNKYIADGKSEEQQIKNVQDDTTEEYVNKNLSGKDNFVDSLTKTSIQATTTLYEKDDNLYYVVQLSEEIRHFFLSGWFSDMAAPVTAVAMLSKTAQAVTPTMPESFITFETPIMPELNFSKPTVTEEEIQTIEEELNSNLIVGNWQVQDKYRGNNDKFTYTDEEGNKVTISLYEAIFGNEVYSEAWNHFQDFYNHYRARDFFRKETITVKDDLVVTSNTDDIGNKIPDKWGEQSSVAATPASINNDKNDSAYNPGVSERKTFKAGITESATVGLPYIWERLDSINIDFRIEVTFGNNSKWLEEDWDIGSDDTDVTFNNTDWDTSGGYGSDDIKKLRIHTNINYEDPYEVREGFDEEDNQDILWTRIESEPILNHPDTTDVSKRLGLTSKIDSTSLNSVHQIFVNFNKSNYDSGDKKYRPVIVFYDGPETNGIYSDYSGWVRPSQPVVINMNVPFRAIIYMPNSPVVLMGDAQDQFIGFVIAKEYRQLMTAEDFDFSHTRYYKEGNRATTIARVYEDGRITDAKGNAIDTIPSNVYSEKVYKRNGSADPTETKDYYYFVPGADNPECGIDIFVDYHGNLQTKELKSLPKRVGSYSNFGRTNFSTHNYNVLGTLADNLLLSGK